MSFGKSLVWDIENELPDELIGTSLDPSDLPQTQSSQSSTQNLLNGTSESVPVESGVVGSVSTQRHQQLSQLLQSKPHGTVQTPPSHAGIPTSQRIPSPSVASITSVKSPHANNLTPPNATVNKSGTPVSSTAHINVSDGSIAITNITNSMVNSLSNTTGTMGMASNMLLMQSKGGTLGSQGSLVSLSTSVAGNSSTGSLHHPPPTAVVSPQLTQQPNAGSLINGSHMALGNANSLSMTRGVNPNVSSAVLAPHSPHQNILGHPSLSNQGANLKVCQVLHDIKQH